MIFFPLLFIFTIFFPNVLVNLPRDWRVVNYLVSNTFPNLSLKDISIFTLTMHRTPLDDSKWHWSPRIFSLEFAKPKTGFSVMWCTYLTWHQDNSSLKWLCHENNCRPIDHGGLKKSFSDIARELLMKKCSMWFPPGLPLFGGMFLPLNNKVYS